jgi:hypothetical protein
LNDLVCSFWAKAPYQGAFTSRPYPWSPNRKAIRSLPGLFLDGLLPGIGNVSVWETCIFFFWKAKKISLGRKKLRFAVALASFFGPSFGLVTGLHEALQKEALP